MNNICEWKDSYYFPENYSVSSDGQVINKNTQRVLRPNTDKYGYLYYVLCVKGNRKTVKAHRLVALTFIDNPMEKPAVDHINGDKTDNRVENLRWVTNRENSHNDLTLPKLRRNAMRNMPKLQVASVERNYGGIRTSVYKDGILMGVFDSQKMAAEFTGVSIGKVSQCAAGEKMSCKGYVFMRPEEQNE